MLYTTRCIKQDKLKKNALLSLVVKRKKSNKDNKQIEKLLNSVGGGGACLWGEVWVYLHSVKCVVDKCPNIDDLRNISYLMCCIN